MLRMALMFFILALVAIIFGATGFAGVSMEIGKTSSVRVLGAISTELYRQCSYWPEKS